MRKAVWKAQAIVVIPLAEIYDGPFKTEVERWARKTYGLRSAK